MKRFLLAATALTALTLAAPAQAQYVQSVGDNPTSATGTFNHAVFGTTFDDFITFTLSGPAPYHITFGTAENTFTSSTDFITGFTGQLFQQVGAPTPEPGVTQMPPEASQAPFRTDFTPTAPDTAPADTSGGLGGLLGGLAKGLGGGSGGGNLNVETHISPGMGQGYGMSMPVPVDTRGNVPPATTFPLRDGAELVFDMAQSQAAQIVAGSGVRITGQAKLRLECPAR